MLMRERVLSMRSKLTFLMICSVLLLGCGVLSLPTPTPLPGWRSLTSDLLLEDDAFPEGWTRIRDWPVNSLTDVTINHVYRSWWGGEVSNWEVEQVIWRAYSIKDAEEYYAKRRQGQFAPPSGTLAPYDLYVEFVPPEEIAFKSQDADEFYLACGWWTWAYCEVVARYHNYVVEMQFDLEAEHEGEVSHGMTYAEIESIIRAMDAEFSEGMEELYPADDKSQRYSE